MADETNQIDQELRERLVCLLVSVIEPTTYVVDAEDIIIEAEKLVNYIKSGKTDDVAEGEDE